MSDIATTTTAIALGLMLLGAGLAWLWIGFEEVLKQRKAWRASSNSVDETFKMIPAR